MKLNISDIQRFSLGDGAGIRTTVFFKGCNLHCPWCHNPETISSAPQVLYYKGTNRQKICGRFMTPEEICEVISEDTDFFTESGGGVTISGGEVMLQAEGAAELCKLLKEKKLNIILDTAGDVPYSEFRKVEAYVDEYFYDWKAADRKDYERVIGGNYEQIYDNLCKLIAEGKKVRVRIPLIEGFNTDREYSEKMCACLQKAGAYRVDLLPFHRLGSAKYADIGKKYAYGSVPSMTVCRAEEIAEIYKKYFQIKIEK